MDQRETDDDRSRRRQSIPLQDIYTLGGSSLEYSSNEYNTGPSGPQTSATVGSSHWHSARYVDADGMDVQARPESPIDLTALQMALPPEIQHTPLQHSDVYHSSSNPFDTSSAYIDDAPNQDYSESDTAPLTAGAQPISGALGADIHGSEGRQSFQTVSDFSGSPRGRTTLRVEQPTPHSFAGGRNSSHGMSLSPNNFPMPRSSSPSGAFLRAGSIVRAMSQRVVNISGESERAVNPRVSRESARPAHGPERDFDGNNTQPIQLDTSYAPQTPQAVGEKSSEPSYFGNQTLPLPPTGRQAPNPLKGRSLGVFSPSNRVRRFCCDVLVNPYTEPVILLLIVLQTILLTVEAAPSVFSHGHGRPDRWGKSAMDWAMLALFIIFTFELAARIIVSGFMLNAAEYSSIDRKKGVRSLIVDQYQSFFQPERRKSMKGHRPSRQETIQPFAIARSFTNMMQGQQSLPKTHEDQMRYQLARRAFLRHSFNRLDILAVVSFWISFVLGITGLESRYHLYVFKMLSCLRILRLLALTHGTAVSLRCSLSACFQY